MSNKDSLLAHAHDYADRFDWAIVPVVGKSAKCCKWTRYQKVKPSRKQRGGLFSNKAVTGLAVVLGEVSGGLRVRDFDQEDAYTRWAEAYPDLASSLPTARTRRGYHVYFRANITEGVTTYEDGELRAGKCIVVLPPSPHPEGGIYEWVQPPQDAIPFIPTLAETGLQGPAPAASPDHAPVPTAVTEAIAKTLPTRTGRRHDLIFDFARRLKGIAGLDTSAVALSSYIAEWHQQALPFIKTKDFLATEIAFLDSWNNATVPLSDEQFWGVVEEALKQPDPGWFKDWFFPATGKRLTRVCMALQAHWKEEPFFLSARTAGEAVGISPKDANDLLKRLVIAGFLLEVKKGTYESRLATMWRFKKPAA